MFDSHIAALVDSAAQPLRAGSAEGPHYGRIVGALSQILFDGMEWDTVRAQYARDLLARHGYTGEVDDAGMPVTAEPREVGR